MKKLTAGIFTVLMGLVSVNAADAAVASKAYVDEVASAAQAAAESTAAGALSSAKTELEGKIDAKVSQTEYNTKVQALEAADATFATTSAMNTELAKKQNNLTVTGGVLTWDANTSTLGLTGIATDSSVSALEGKVDTLNGDVNTAGSVKRQIADAIADEVSRSNGAYDAAGAAATAEQNAKDYADGLASNYDAAGSADAALAAAKTYAESEADAAEAAAKSYADGLASNYDVAGSAASALTAAKAYTDELENGAVKANADAIAALNDTYVSENEMNTFKASNTDAIADAKKAGTDAAAALETYKSSNDTALAGVKTTAEKGVADAATAKSAADAAQAAAEAAAAAAATADGKAVAAQETADAAVEAAAVADGKAVAAQGAADAAQATANAAIPKPTGECSNPTNKCVLTFNNSAYTWEVIERGDNE